MILDKNKCKKLEPMCCKLALALGLPLYRQAGWDSVELQLLQLALWLPSLCYGLPIAACGKTNDQAEDKTGSSPSLATKFKVMGKCV